MQCEAEPSCYYCGAPTKMAFEIPEDPLFYAAFGADMAGLMTYPACGDCREIIKNAEPVDEPESGERPPTVADEFLPDGDD